MTVAAYIDSQVNDFRLRFAIEISDFTALLYELQLLYAIFASTGDLASFIFSAVAMAFKYMKNCSLELNT